jgi:hypothetical protein
MNLINDEPAITKHYYQDFISRCYDFVYRMRNVILLLSRLTIDPFRESIPENMITYQTALMHAYVAGSGDMTRKAMKQEVL